ncbi:hypothetical protein [Falsiroseomonas sp. HW251]|uniref:hypothetical protein n=1 Tax=Falsiroseomonas sp. HW251 TaxID=3390998 RepID=UPI003D31FBF2
MKRPKLIPARDAAICWFCEGGAAGAFAVTAVHVFHARDILPGGPANSIWSRPDAITHGCVFSDWMNGMPNMTPEWVFSELMIFHGFADSRVAEQALAEFAKIDTCAWARAMVPTDLPDRPQVHWRWAPPR